MGSLVFVCVVVGHHSKVIPKLELKTLDARQKFFEIMSVTFLATMTISEISQKVYADRYAELQLAEINIHIAKAETKIETIDKHTADRGFSAEGRINAVQFLRELNGYKLEMQYSAGDGEAQRYAELWVELFKEAGWTVANPNPLVNLGPPRPPFQLEVSHATADEKFRLALGRALTALNIPPSEPNVVPNESLQNGTVFIWVGNKPK